MKKIIKENKVFILSSFILSLLLTASVDFVETKHFSVLNFDFWFKYIIFTCGFIFLFSLIKYIDNKIVKKINMKKDEKYSKENLIKIFLINSIILFAIFWMAYIALYPGYFSYDAPGQIIQVFHYKELNAHQPVIHTLLLSVCIAIGNKFFWGTNCGLAIYTFIQMMIVILSLSYIFIKLLEFNVNKYVIIISEALIIINPVFQIFVMTSTKDVIFSSLFIIWIIHVVEMYESGEKFFASVSKNIFYVINVILMCLFRKQGIYVVFCVGLVQCFTMKKYFKKYLCSFICIIAIFNFIIGPVSSWLGIVESPVKEILSVPLQQMSRVINENGNITDEQKEMFYKFVPKNKVKNYIPYISDPIKDNMNEIYFKLHIKDFIKLYIDLGIKNFSIYVDSFLYGIVGYVAPVEDEENIYIGIFEFIGPELYEVFGLPYIKEGAVFEETKFEGYKNYLYHVRETLLVDIPIISFWCNTSFSFWIFAVCTIIIIYKKNYKYLIVSLIALIFGGILALGPVCCIRYIIPIKYAIPIIISLATKNNNVDLEENNKVKN